MDTQRRTQELRALLTVLTEADHAVDMAGEKVSEAKTARCEAQKNLEKADTAVQEVETKIAAEDVADLEALWTEHATRTTTRDEAEAALVAAGKALSAAKKDRKVRVTERKDAEARLQAFRRGQPYQPTLPGTEPAARIEVVEPPKRKAIEAALRAADSLAAAAEQLGIDTKVLKSIVAARGIDLGIIGADIPRGARKPEPRSRAKGGATA